MSGHFTCSYYLRLVQILGGASFSSFFRWWKLTLSDTLVTWSAGDFNLTLGEFSSFMCKLEKLSIQLKLQGLRYSRILQWEANGKPIDWLSRFFFSIFNTSVCLCVSCKLKWQEVPVFFSAPKGLWWHSCGHVIFLVCSMLSPLSDFLAFL